ncbi:hypothetical protein IKX64_01080 [Candidatus Saccharibacteria bacterium]|nr:hypothetical protein [Candidatus Saccharibacteria bacterium]
MNTVVLEKELEKVAEVFANFGFKRCGYVDITVYLFNKCEEVVTIGIGCRSLAFDATADRAFLRWDAKEWQTYLLKRTHYFTSMTLTHVAAIDIFFSGTEAGLSYKIEATSFKDRPQFDRMLVYTNPIREIRLTPKESAQIASTRTVRKFARELSRERFFKTTSDTALVQKS